MIQRTGAHRFRITCKKRITGLTAVFTSTDTKVGRSEMWEMALGFNGPTVRTEDGEAAALMGLGLGREVNSLGA